MPRSYSRNNNAVEANIFKNTLFGEGSFKNVYKGIYTSGERTGEVRSPTVGSAHMTTPLP